MYELIPGVLEKDWRHVKERLGVISHFAQWAHVDVSDGVFTSNVTWQEPRDFAEIEDAPKVEVHLMIERPWRYIDKWLRPPVERIVVHYEAFSPPEATLDDIVEFAQRVRKEGREIVLAFNPHTRWQSAERAIPVMDGVLMLGVHPGYSGAEFHPRVIENMAEFHKKHPTIPITADGGVNPRRVGKMIEAGAERFVSTSYIFSHANPEDAVREFEHEFEKSTR